MALMSWLLAPQKCSAVHKCLYLMRGLLRKTDFKGQVTKLHTLKGLHEKILFSKKMDHLRVLGTAQDVIFIRVENGKGIKVKPCY